MSDNIAILTRDDAAEMLRKEANREFGLIESGELSVSDETRYFYLTRPEFEKNFDEILDRYIVKSVVGAVERGAEGKKEGSCSYTGEFERALMERFKFAELISSGKDPEVLIGTLTENYGVKYEVPTRAFVDSAVQACYDSFNVNVAEHAFNVMRKDTAEYARGANFGLAINSKNTFSRYTSGNINAMNSMIITKMIASEGDIAITARAKEINPSNYKTASITSSKNY